MLVEGEAGIGKSALLEATAAAAGDRGVTVLAARGTPLGAGLAFGVVRHALLPPLLELTRPDRAALLSGPAAAARLILDPDSPDYAEGPGAPFEPVHAVAWAVVGLADRLGPLALLLDDVHWADPASLRVLVGLAERLAGLPVAAVMAARPSPSFTEPELAAAVRRAGAVLRPARLSVAGVSEVLADRLGAPVPAELAGQTATLTAGSPYLVAAVSAAVRRHGGAPGDVAVAGAAEIEGDLAARLARLAPATRHLVEAVAVAGDGRAVGELAAVSGVDGDFPAAVAAAVEEGLLVASPEPGFDHAIVRSAVLTTLGPVRRAELHRAAADHAMAVGDAERAAAHLAHVPGVGDPARVALLRRVAHGAACRGATELEITHLRRALAEPPSAGEHPAILAELAFAEAASNDPAAPDRLAAVAAVGGSADVRLRAGMVRGHCLGLQGRTREAVEAMRAAVRDAGAAGPDARRLAELELALAERGGRSTAAAGAERLLALVAARPGRDDELGRLIEGCLALHHAFGGSPRDATLARIDRALGSGAPVRRRTTAAFAPAYALVHLEAFERAEPLLDAMVLAGRRSGSAFAVNAMEAWRSWALLRQGRVSEAGEAAEAAGRPPVPMVRSLTVAVRAAVALERGDLTRARILAADPVEVDPDLGESWVVDLLLTERGRAQLAAGDAPGAVRTLLEVGVRQRALGAESPAATLWRSEASLALAAAGRVAEARELIEEEVVVAGRFGAPRPLAEALRVQARLGGPSARRLLDEAVELLDGAGIPLGLARCRFDRGVMRLRDGAEAAGREDLGVALELAWRCGAGMLVARTRAALVAAGARPRRPVRTGVHALTGAEARSARLAAAGASNREIAAELYLSVKTVEQHLTHTYRKLGVHGRSELVAALGDGTGAGSPRA